MKNFLREPILELFKLSLGVMVFGIFFLIIPFLFDKNGMDEVFEAHKKLNDKREQEISSIKNKIEAYKTTSRTFPIAKNFDELKGVIGYIKNDVRYHYSYESNGIYYIFSYPEDTTSGVRCKIIKIPEITEVSPEDKEKLCNIVTKKRASGEKE